MCPALEPLYLDDYCISVVLPVYSETRTVRQIVDWLGTHLGARLLEVIIVISPRSSSDSQAVCSDLAREHQRVRVFEQQENPGVGRAFREGYARVRGNVVLSMDSDGEMELETIPRMIAEMARSNVGLVVGSRWLPGGGFVGYSPSKQWLNWGFQQLFRVFFRTRVHDLTYGFKLMRTELVRNIAWEATLHEIGCETTLKPIRLGVAVAEVPTTWRARVEGRSSNNFLRNFRYVGMALSILMKRVSNTSLEAQPVKTDLDRDRDQCQPALQVAAARVLAGQTAERDLE
jgi:dolichol-phosphate mannosyltransferase